MVFLACWNFNSPGEAACLTARARCTETVRSRANYSRPPIFKSPTPTPGCTNAAASQPSSHRSSSKGPTPIAAPYAAFGNRCSLTFHLRSAESRCRDPAAPGGSAYIITLQLCCHQLSHKRSLAAPCYVYCAPRPPSPLTYRRQAYISVFSPSPTPFSTSPNSPSQSQLLCCSVHSPYCSMRTNCRGVVLPLQFTYAPGQYTPTHTSGQHASGQHVLPVTQLPWLSAALLSPPLLCTCTLSNVAPAHAHARSTQPRSPFLFPHRHAMPFLYSWVS